MPKRSLGYRARKGERTQVDALRVQLSWCHSHDWVRANMIMQNITSLIGNDSPMGGLVAPRACRYCKYYGHGKNDCV